MALRSELAGIRRIPGVVLALSLGVAGCAGSGKGLDANGQPAGPGDSGNQPLTADFDSIQANVFTPICTACHAGATAPEGLRLDAADSYDLLVGVPSTEEASLLRVKPGDPDDSYVIQKLEGHAAVGARMPFGGPYLAGEVIAVIRQWISDGALRSATAPPAAFTLVAMAPADGESLPTAPPQIMLAFSADLDATRVTPDAVRIERLTQDTAEMLAEPVPARAEIPAANPRALLLWPASALLPGRYRLVAPAVDDDGSGRQQRLIGSFDIAPAASTGNAP